MKMSLRGIFAPVALREQRSEGCASSGAVASGHLRSRMEVVTL
jgi:hypothetical protein